MVVIARTPEAYELFLISSYYECQLIIVPYWRLCMCATRHTSIFCIKKLNNQSPINVKEIFYFGNDLICFIHSLFYSRQQHCNYISSCLYIFCLSVCMILLGWGLMAVVLYNSKMLTSQFIDSLIHIHSTNHHLLARPSSQFEINLRMTSSWFD